MLGGAHCTGIYRVEFEYRSLHCLHCNHQRCRTYRYTAMDLDSPMENEFLATMEQEKRKECFAPVQSRKFRSPVISPGCRLCPSMDIVVVTTPSSLFLHRTVSWQKLASLSAADLDNEQVNHVAWSPDGRAMAIALSNGTIVLHHIEGMSSSASSSMEANTASHTIDDLEHDAIVVLTWAHVGRPHTNWRLSNDEFEIEESWRYSSHYLDKSSTFLPPTSYLMEDDSNEGEHASRSSLPSSHTPLSLLCVATATKGIRLYLHGRYHIATLPLDEGLDGNQIVCSSDLTHLLVQSKDSSILKSYYLPTLKQHRYHLQIISSLYCSIASHLNAIRQHAKEALASWKSSLKPLDTKLDGLTRLLKKYGVTEDMRTVLFRYIMVGHTSVSSDASNAMDQFFTGVQMNDQLIQRLERSLHGAVGNVETLVRKGLLAPARSLVYDASEVHGQFSAFAAFDSDAAAANDSHYNSTTSQLYQSCEILLVTAEQVVAQVVQARFRLRDLVSWLRSIGSQIKARGTAVNSGHRDNARKRRVPEAVVQRMASYLQPLSSVVGNAATTAGSTSMTECLLNVPLSHFFAESNPTFVHLSCHHNLPSSPRSVQSGTTDMSVLSSLQASKAPTISYAASRVSEFMDLVFEQPRTTLSQSLFPTKLELLGLCDAKAFGIHTRIGLDHCKNDIEEAKGFFQPRILGDENELYSCSRQWSIMAKTGSLASGDEFVQFFVIPTRRDGTTPFNEEHMCEKDKISFYLTSRIVLPPQCQVKELAFYGDDGRSSLSSGADSGTGEEGRQGIGFLLDREEHDVVPRTVSEELWLLSYDNLLFQPFPVVSVESIVLEEYVDDECTVRVQPISNTGDESYADDGALYAKTRQLRVHEVENPPEVISESRLMLSGTRGIGGVFTSSNGYTSLHIFDLEEDEEDSDEDEPEDIEE